MSQILPYETRSTVPFVLMTNSTARRRTLAPNSWAMRDSSGTHRSLGTYQETPIDVVLRFKANTAPDASAFQFHPDQTIEEHGDGTLRVRFNNSHLAWPSG